MEYICTFFLNHTVFEINKKNTIVTFPNLHIHAVNNGLPNTREYCRKFLVSIIMKRSFILKFIDIYVYRKQEVKYYVQRSIS
jgi:hypothetical protein